MARELQLIIGGQHRSGEAVEIHSPYDGSVVGVVHRGSAVDAEDACAAAASAFQETRRMPSFRRAEILSHLARIVEQRQEEFAAIICDEAAKPIKAARVEAARAATTLAVAAEEAKRIGGEAMALDWIPAAQGRKAMTWRFPIGPVLAISPFNFPLNLVAHKLGPALAVGNPIICRPSSATPMSALALGEAALEAGWPAEAISVIPCPTSVAEQMLADERVKKLSFTGSAEVGWHLKAQAPRKKITLELGGNAGVIVDHDADLDWAAERCTFGGFSYSGQICISVQRIFIQRSVYDDFVARLLERVGKLKLGDPRDEATDIGPMITERDAIRAESWVVEAVEAGAEVLIGGRREGAMFWPTVIANVKPEMKVCCEEVFAPVVTVSPFDDFDDAVRAVDDSRYGLQAGVFTHDVRRAFRAFEDLEVGGVIINDVPTFRVDHMPYGGVKDSGLGREGLRWAIEEMTELRLLVLNLS